MVKRVVFEEEDDSVVDFETSVPSDLLKSLLCRTEEAVIEMNKTLLRVAALVSDQTDVLHTDLPKLVKSVEAVAEVIEENSREGFERTEKLVSKIDDMIEASRGVVNGLQGTTKST